jgi:hypothetical protein
VVVRYDPHNVKIFAPKAEGLRHIATRHLRKNAAASVDGGSQRRHVPTHSLDKLRAAAGLPCQALGLRSNAHAAATPT